MECTAQLSSPTVVIVVRSLGCSYLEVSANDKALHCAILALGHNLQVYFKVVFWVPFFVFLIIS
jgi:hypothetical protein